MSLLKTLSTYSFSRYYKVGFLVWDVVLLNTAIFLSFLFRYGYASFLDNIDNEGVKAICLFSNIIWIFLLLNRDFYRIIRTERIETILYRTIRILIIHIALIAIIIIVLNYDDVSRLRLTYFYLTFIIFLVVFRIFFMKLLKYVRSRGYNFRKVVIVGANAMGERMNRILSKDLTYGFRVIGFFDDQPENKEINAPLLGNFDAIESYLNQENIDELYVALHIDKIEIINRITSICERYMVRIRYIPDFQQYTKSNRVQVLFYGNANIPVLMFRTEPLEITLNRIIKKIFDFCFSLFVIVFVFTWLFPIIILIIKIDSSGPVFFIQQRSGRDNKPFPCYKFRTMYVNDLANVAQATKNDRRVTKVGAFLRRTSIDELPQFFNVISGNMSVVGPRPHMLSHTLEYSELINNFLVRHYAKPGITGWAQVNGFRGETKILADMEGRVELDIWYIENWSFLLDLKIIWMTITNVYNGEKDVY